MNAGDKLTLTITDIDGALRLKFRIAIKLGLLDLPEMVPYSNIKDSPEPWNTDKHRDISRPIALESVVLLKNDKNFLPRDKNSIKSIAVIGPLADCLSGPALSIPLPLILFTAQPESTKK